MSQSGEANQIDRSTIFQSERLHVSTAWRFARVLVAEGPLALRICLGRWSLGTSVINFHGFDDMIWHDFPRGTCPCLWRVLRKSTASNMLWKKVLMVNHGCVKRVTPHLANESTQCNLATAPRSWRKSWETRKMRMQRYLRETFRLGSSLGPGDRFRSKLVAAFAAAQQLLEPSAAISLSQVRSKNDCEMIWANIGVPINAGGWKKTKTTHPKTVGWKVLYFYSRHLTAFPPYYILSPPLPQQPKPGPCRFPLNPTSGGCAKAGFSPAGASQWLPLDASQRTLRSHGWP